MEVLVQLDNLSQRGSGVMTIQTKNGVVFDSIVFGEQTPRHWLSGSNSFKRTKPFKRAEPETLEREPIHLVLTFQDDGSVTCFRNGSQYGDAYKTSLQSFDPSDASVVFGMRHGRGVASGRMLQGQIMQARLYDRALEQEEVRALAEATNYLSRSQIIASLSKAEQARLANLEEELQELSLANAKNSEPVSSNQPWIDLAHAIFNMKEFIYVQ